MLLRLLAFLALCTSAALPASAKWHEASSDHFVIYADQDAERVRAFSERLERFHSAMQYRMRAPDEKPSPSNRVTVYVVRDAAQVRKLFGTDNRYVAGFYNARAGGSFAIIPKIKVAEDWELSGEEILFHEYAHHFMYGTSSRSYPLWFSEGFAEFYSNTRFEKDGAVGLGLPATHRAAELVLAKNVPITHLLDTKTYLQNKGKGYDEFYGRSWLLFHYLYFNETRKGQFDTYLKQIAAGTPELEAATTAFGDLDTLDKELARYLKQPRMSYVKILPAALSVGQIAVRALDEGEAAMMPVRIRSKRGVTPETAPELVPEARKIAAQYSQNATVMSALAEAEFDAGNNKEAIAAADAAIALDPNNVNAHLQKAFAMAHQAEGIVDEKAAKKAWVAVRSQLLKVNAIENNHPVPLMQYFMTYARSGATPTANAVQGLEWALQLAPYDEELRFMVAQQQIFEKRFDDAIAVLEPIANSPHQSEMTAAAQSMINSAEAEKAAAVDGDASPAS